MICCKVVCKSENFLYFAVCLKMFLKDGETWKECWAGGSSQCNCTTELDCPVSEEGPAVVKSLHPAAVRSPHPAAVSGRHHLTLLSRQGLPSSG